MIHVKFYYPAHILSFKTRIQFLDIVIQNYYQLSKQADLISHYKSWVSNWLNPPQQKRYEVQSSHTQSFHSYSIQTFRRSPLQGGCKLAVRSCDRKHTKYRCTLTHVKYSSSSDLFGGSHAQHPFMISSLVKWELESWFLITRQKAPPNEWEIKLKRTVTTLASSNAVNFAFFCFLLVTDTCLKASSSTDGQLWVCKIHNIKCLLQPSDPRDLLTSKSVRLSIKDFSGAAALFQHQPPSENKLSRLGKPGVTIWAVLLLYNHSTNSTTFWGHRLSNW